MAAPQLTGTHTSDVNPWDAYAAEMSTKMGSELESAVLAYAENYYTEESTSNQNKEELCRQQELSAEVAKEYQWVKPEEYADSGARIGKIMNHAELIALLRKSGLTVYYRQHVHADKVTMLVRPPKTPGGELEVGPWVTYGYMPELSIMSFDSQGAPLAERMRGWRTVLLQLILKGFITEDAADKLFGKPGVTPQYHRYNSTLQAFRNNGNSLTLHGEEDAKQ